MSKVNYDWFKHCFINLVIIFIAYVYVEDTVYFSSLHFQVTEGKRRTVIERRSGNGQTTDLVKNNHINYCTYMYTYKYTCLRRKLIGQFFASYSRLVCTEQCKILQIQWIMRFSITDILKAPIHLETPTIELDDRNLNLELRKYWLV